MAVVKVSGRVRDREDIANALAHFIGALLSVAGLILMVVISVKKGNTWYIISSIIFGSSMIFLYLSSSIAHWLPEGRKKEIFFILDQTAIFTLIAGTYTPLTLIALHGTRGWLLFLLEWGLAVSGIIRILKRDNKIKSGVGIWDILIYTIMGWLVVIVAPVVIKSVSLMGFVWIIIGGLFYTTGIIFFRFTRFRYDHLIWHLMVIGGTGAHFIAIFFYILK